MTILPLCFGVVKEPTEDHMDPRSRKLFAP